MRDIDEIFIPLKKLHSGNIQQNVDDVVVLAFSSLRSDPIQRRKWQRLREMHTYGTSMSLPSLVQQVWWRDRLDQQHNGVVLMVENFCSRVSPTCSHEREMWRAAVGPAARVRRGAHPSPPLPSPLNRSRGSAKGAALASKSIRWPQGENIPPKFPLPLAHKKTLGFCPWPHRTSGHG
jgi:hypothetical protein